MPTIPRRSRAVESPSPARRPATAPIRTAIAIFVNFTKPDGSIGSIRVKGGTTCAAVAEAKTLGTDIWIRAIDAEGACLDRVRVRA
jgi:hypothetical protein